MVFLYTKKQYHSWKTKRTISREVKDLGYLGKDSFQYPREPSSPSKGSLNFVKKNYRKNMELDPRFDIYFIKIYYKDWFVEKGQAPFKKCNICLADFGFDDELRRISACKHTFHRKCLLKHLEMHEKCPICLRDTSFEAQGKIVDRRSPKKLGERPPKPSQDSSEIYDPDRSFLP